MRHLSTVHAILSHLILNKTKLVLYTATPVYSTVNGVRSPYNPLEWWRMQRATGNKYKGLTQMALDTLSTPGAYNIWSISATLTAYIASSVNIERVFLFAGSIVTKRRHHLAPCTIQATASLGSYSKAGLVKPGMLHQPRRGKKAVTVPID